MIDDLVQKSLARWPNVPSLTGWLRLTEQGQWRLTGPVPEGLTISNERILNFIARNYACDETGRYYFQNGPQKVFVSLAVTPWVYRLYPLDSGDLMLVTHTGLVVKPKAVYQDEQGRIFLTSHQGVGLLHGADTVKFADYLVQEGPSDALCHQASWVILADPAAHLPRTRVPFRLAQGEIVGVFELSLPLNEVAAAQLPELFLFEPEPEV